MKEKFLPYGFLLLITAVASLLPSHAMGDTAFRIEGPDIISRGFVYVRDSEDLIEEAKERVIGLLESGKMHRDTAATVISDQLSQFLYRRTHRNPMIFPVVLEV